MSKYSNEGPVFEFTLEFTRDRYPNWWYLVNLSYMLSTCDASSVKEFCQLLRRTVTGAGVAALLPLVISLAVVVVIEFPILLIHGSLSVQEYVFNPLTAFMSLTLWTVTLTVLQIISMIELVKGLNTKKKKN